MTVESMNRTQEIGRVVSVLLALKGETQNDLARVLGVDPASVTRRIRNGRGSWTPEQLEAIAEHFDVPVGVLFKSPQDIADAVAAVTRGSLQLGHPAYEDPPPLLAAA